MMIDVEVFVGGGWILPRDGYRRRSDCVVDERRTNNDTADNADGRKPKPDIEEISDAVFLEDRSHAGQSAVSACEQHLDERSRLAVDSEYGFEQEPDEDPADCQLAHCHHQVHDYVRARDAPDRLEGWEALAQQERGGHRDDQQARHLSPDGEYIIWKDPAPADQSAHPFRAEPEDEKTADDRGGNEKFAQRSGPASNERCARKDDRENDEREADLFRAALHAQLLGWTRAVRGHSRSPPITTNRTR